MSTNIQFENKTAGSISLATPDDSMEDDPPSPHVLERDFLTRSFWFSNLNRSNCGLMNRRKEPSDGLSPFVINSGTKQFIKTHYPLTYSQWNDWHWQLQHCIHTADELGRMILLSESEKNAINQHASNLPMSITPYYAGLLATLEANHPLRKTVIVSPAEEIIAPEEKLDPLGEEQSSPVPHLVHRYPDRVLFLVTETCSVYCRYCTRSRLVGQEGLHACGPDQWEPALQYIAAHPEIRDVLLSGGDPLTLSDGRLEWLLRRLRVIPHVEIIRIGTKIPAVLPMRITPALAAMLRRYHPIWTSLHFTHPDELTPETAQACERLADAGIPLGSQTVLLKDVNDNVDTMRRLNQELMKMRVRPYYLYQCDPVQGSSHFRTSVAKGLEIIAGLRGHTSGYAVPQFVIDAPGGGGKIPLLPEYFKGRDGDDILLENFRGNLYRYPDCVDDSMQTASTR